MTCRPRRRCTRPPRPTLPSSRALPDSPAIDAQIIPRQTPLPTGIVGWLRTFRSGFLDTIGVPGADQMRFAAQVEDFLAPMLRTPAGDWIADYVRLRFSAKKPE